MIFSVTASGVFLLSIDGTFMPVVLPELERSFGESTTAISWVLSGFTIAQAALLVPMGRIADRLGRRRVFLAGLSLIVVGAAGTAASQTLTMLVASRCVVGVGAACAMPSGLGLLLSSWPEGETTRAVAAWMAVGAVAGATGPTLGAGIVDGFGWRWAFLMSVVIGLCALAWGRRVLEDTERDESQSFPDPVGVVLAAVMLACLTTGLVQGRSWGWTDTRVVGSLAAAVVLAPVFFWRSANHPAPVLQPELLRLKTYRRALMVSLLTPMTLFANFILMVQFLSRQWDYGTFRSGLAIVPFPVIAILVSLVIGRLSKRVDERSLVVAGIAIYLAGVLWFLLVPTTEPDYVRTFLPGVLLVGIGGWGTALTGINAVTARQLNDENYSVGMGVQASTRQVGSLVGFGVVFGLLGADGDAAGIDVFHQIWTVLIAVGLVAIGLTLRIERRPAVPSVT